jgi:hypothetical protein
MLRYLVAFGCLLTTGCSLVPEIAYQPTVHNPFPQFSKVAVAPFFNLSTEPTLDGRRVGLAYYNALQSVPGFEVVPVGVVETAMRDNKIALRGPSDARRLAQLLDVDAVIVGAITDYSPYYPPRCAIQVEWYAANPCFHPVPPGYGLPWGTPEEDQIPAPLVFEAELALAKAQMATQTPPVEKPFGPPSAVEAANFTTDHNIAETEKPALSASSTASDMRRGAKPGAKSAVMPAQYNAPENAASVAAAPGGAQPGFPPNWPDPRGFIPPPPNSQPPPCWPSDAPVIRHTRTYNGNDPQVTEALSTYWFFQNDARYGGWQSSLQRSDDFIRFCCHMHVSETLTARGGAGETRLVWRWPPNR